MKVLAIVFTDGTLNSIRPEAELFIAMHSKGIEIDVMCHQGSEYAAIFRSNGMRIVGNYPKNKRDTFAVAKIRDLLIKNNYDLLHVLHRPAIVCGIKAAKNVPVKVVVYRGASGLYWHDPTAYENALNKRVDKVICVCNSIRDNLQKQFFFKKEKAISIYKGHRLEWYADVKKADLSLSATHEKPLIITCIANNRKWKGIPDVLQAIELLPAHYHILVLLIGQGLDDDFFRRHIAHLKNRDKIRALGFRNNVLNFTAASDVSIQYSYKNEGLSRSTIEAMSLGVVPIVSDAGGNPELVESEHSGLVVPAKSPILLSQAIIRLYQDKYLLKRLSRDAKNRIKTSFTLEQSVEKTIATYEELISS